MVSWYSHESVSSTTSSTVGWGDRSIDSVFPVQSWNSIQTSTGFLRWASACATALEYVEGSARVADIVGENSRNWRRDMPRVPQDSSTDSALEMIICRTSMARLES